MTPDDAKVNDAEIQDAPPNNDAPMRDPERRSAVRRLWRAETAYAVVLAGFGVLALFAHFDTYFDWDLSISRGLQSLNVPGLFGFMRFVSFFGNRWIPWALTITAVILFFVFGKRSEAAGLTLSAGVGALVNTLVKMLIGRPRPTAELVSVYRSLRTESFPSGHVSFYVCFFGFLFFVAFALLPRGSFVRRVALVLTALPVALVGLSRIYLGAHWPSDTLGAYLLSGLWLALSLHLYRRWKQKATFHPEEKV
ncbi:MAG TPA: phosphatase PAP2 family protein [Pyrinomonadaceae bacterium]|jgi:undecaprenyl-diphosphatase